MLAGLSWWFYEVYFVVWFQIEARFAFTKARSKSTNLMYKWQWYSNVCSRRIRNVFILSMQLRIGGILLFYWRIVDSTTGNMNAIWIRKNNYSIYLMWQMMGSSRRTTNYWYLVHQIPLIIIINIWYPICCYIWYTRMTYLVFMLEWRTFPTNYVPNLNVRWHKYYSSVKVLDLFLIFWSKTKCNGWVSIHGCFPK